LYVSPNVGAVCNWFSIFMFLFNSSYYKICKFLCVLLGDNGMISPWHSSLYYVDAPSYSFFYWHWAIARMSLPDGHIKIGAVIRGMIIVNFQHRTLSGTVTFDKNWLWLVHFRISI
jgi:hypothetical protein